MKRFSIILLGALAILMAGCSKDTHTASKDQVSDDWTVNLDLPVPIEFGSGGLATKAAFSSMDDLKSNESTELPFGIFAINKDAETVTSDDLLLDNQRALYMDVEGEEKFILTGFSGTTEVPQYYPMVSEKAYNFYGYYARKTSYDSATDTEQVNVKVTVADTLSDILWAKATATTYTDYEGYNARYVRKHPDDKPTLNFKHVTSCLKFRAIYSPNEGETTSEMSDIRVTSITIKDVYTAATLRVIDLEDPDNEGELMVTGDPTEVKFSIADANQQNLIECKDDNGYAAASLYSDIFIAPQDEALDVQFVIKYTPINGTQKSQTVTYTVDPSVWMTTNDDVKIEDGDGNVIRLFEAGYKYGFNIKIYSPEKISIDVKLEEFENAFKDKDGNDTYADIVIE